MNELHKLIYNIPDAAESHTGFLEIINKQNHENINSSVYAHFINTSEPLVSDLFLDSLLELVEEKSGKQLSFGEAVARCEVKTEKGRLDILVSDLRSKNHLIIENKIFHWLHNDLLDYWNHIQVRNEYKAGILLTPEPHAIPNEVEGKFINITHSEWIRKIKERGLPFGISPKYTTYITDFANTVEQFTKSYIMDEQTKFYFQHAPQIIKVQETVHAAHQFLNNQLQLIADTLGLDNYGNSLDWRNLWDAKNNIDTYITLIPAPLLRGEMHFQIVLELYRNDKNRYVEVEDLLKDNPQYKKMNRGDSKGPYMHFGVRTYHITQSELEHFAETVLSKIRTDFGDALLKTIRYLHPSKDISSWESNFKQELNVNEN